MAPEIITAVIATIPPSLLALAAFISSIRNAQKLTEVHLSLNGRLSEMLLSAKAQGTVDAMIQQDSKIRNNAAELVESTAKATALTLETAAKAAATVITDAAVAKAIV